MLSDTRQDSFLSNMDIEVFKKKKKKLYPCLHLLQKTMQVV